MPMAGRDCSFSRDCRGTSTIEYALLLGLIAMAVLLTGGGMAAEVTKFWTTTSSEVKTAMTKQ